ncbi:hypothetical protein Nepgr_017327 [Nepenthes gracilis]|uniref:H15 domain-containing protein n=1 Tax=Nepenthes gracilis TaxID=150966 RepID=A0AAD3SSE6_NEPGR|nr:hypothetical protein Nepgr_017327 [Nepenthes gracilis]
MATEAVNRPPSLPPYAEMIYSALDELNEKNGSNKTSISKHIESKYPNLPSSHQTLLRHHLTRMKDSGDLIFWKNNYMRPSPDFIRRGRGRPKKDSNSPHLLPHSTPAAAAAFPPKKQPPPPPGGSGKPRGRPRKMPRSTVDELEMDTGGPVKPLVSPRPRGRPPKVRAPQRFGEEEEDHDDEGSSEE